MSPTYRDLGLGEWCGVWQERIVFWLCSLRGHHWGSWLADAPDPELFDLSPKTRMCERCCAYERWSAPPPRDIRDHQNERNT